MHGSMLGAVFPHGSLPLGRRSVTMIVEAQLSAVLPQKLHRGTFCLFTAI
jgi:hypothetical protein